MCSSVGKALIKLVFQKIVVLIPAVKDDLYLESRLRSFLLVYIYPIKYLNIIWHIFQLGHYGYEFRLTPQTSEILKYMTINI